MDKQESEASEREGDPDVGRADKVGVLDRLARDLRVGEEELDLEAGFLVPPILRAEERETSSARRLRVKKGRPSSGDQWALTWRPLPSG